MTPPTILIAENNKQIVSVIETGLRKLGYSVLGFACTGEEAIKKAAATCPDLVLMNISFEDDLDGIEGARQIRTELHIPVVYLVTSEKPIPLEITDAQLFIFTLAGNTDLPAKFVKKNGFHR